MFASISVAVLNFAVILCRRSGDISVGLSPLWFVAVLVCRRFDLTPKEHPYDLQWAALNKKAY